MSRITIILDDERNSKLQEIRGKAIGKYQEGNISFSDVVNYAVQCALDKGFNVNMILDYKEKKLR